MFFAEYTFHQANQVILSVNHDRQPYPHDDCFSVVYFKFFAAVALILYNIF